MRGQPVNHPRLTSARREQPNRFVKASRRALWSADLPQPHRAPLEGSRFARLLLHMHGRHRPWDRKASRGVSCRRRWPKQRV